MPSFLSTFLVVRLCFVVVSIPNMRASPILLTKVANTDSSIIQSLQKIYFQCINIVYKVLNINAKREDSDFNIVNLTLNFFSFNGDCLRATSYSWGAHISQLVRLSRAFLKISRNLLLHYRDDIFKIKKVRRRNLKM